jgi:hypothetical protein
MKMKQGSLVLVLGLMVVLATAAAPKANAGVVVGVRFGAPVYVPPVRVHAYFGPTYVEPAYVAPAYVGPRAYVALRPRPYYRRVYVAPVYRERFYGPRVVVRRNFYGYRR